MANLNAARGIAMSWHSYAQGNQYVLLLQLLQLYVGVCAAACAGRASGHHRLHHMDS
jgi:hypothetical protein